MGSSLSKKTRDRIHGCQRDGGINLNLSECDLEKISNKIVRLKNLCTLNLDNNFLKALPESIARLKTLEELSIQENSLEVLPPQLLKMPHLSKLNVSFNKLTKLPTPISGFKDLTVLRISGNMIGSLPEDFGDLKALERFDWASNELSELPSSVLSLATLTHLDISSNNFIEVPEQISRLEKLEVLILSNNKLSSLPSSIQKLTLIRVLELNNNKFSSLPADICSLHNLEDLSANNNGLTNVDNFEFRQITNLVSLSLKGNQLENFNGSIGHCQKLKILDLQDNLLESLPHQIGWLGVSLRKLYLSRNQLQQLPGEIGFLNPAITLELGGNPLKYPFDALLKRGPEELQEGLKPYVKAYPTNCIARGEGLSASVCGKPTQFEVEAFDKKDRARVNGGDTFTGEMVQLDPEEGKEPFKCAIIFKDLKDGSYSAFYNCQVAGNFETTIRESGDEIKGSPWNTYIEPDVTEGESSEVIGSGLTSGTSGQTSVFTIISKDKWGNRRDTGGDQWGVAIQGGSEPRPVVVDNQDGTYTVNFVPGWAGTYVVHVFFQGQTLSSSPWTANVV